MQLRNPSVLRKHRPRQAQLEIVLVKLSWRALPTLNVEVGQHPFPLPGGWSYMGVVISETEMVYPPATNLHSHASPFFLWG